MGGPCLIDSAGTGIEIEGKFYIHAPACTDNFQVVATRFVFDGATYLSCEHAYQAAKFLKQSHTRATLEQMQPLPGESDEAFGNRCWDVGQEVEDRRADWESAKIKVMLAVNRAKYAQHAALRHDLLCTLPAPLHGNPYTTSWTRGGQQHSWASWNGLVQQLIREELRPPAEQDQHLICNIIRDIGVYSYGSAHAATPGDDMAVFLRELRSHGLVHPHACSVCTFIEESWHTVCSACGAPNVTYAPAFEALQKEREARRTRVPVLLVTDIGADVDDTLALMALCGSDNLQLVGIATTVGNGRQRAALARQWLRALAVPDDSVPVLPLCDANTAGCQRPPGFAACDDFEAAAVGDENDTARAVLQLMCRYSTRLVVIAIAPLTPLAAALQLDEKDGSLGLLRLVNRVYVQGQAEVSESPPFLVSPGDVAYNFRIDMAAASEVLQQLHAAQRRVSFLGKHAAYQISLTKQDLESLDDPLIPSLTLVARDQMQEFKRQNPSQFYHLFPVPERFRSDSNEADFAWFQHLPGGIVSHPYDALVVLMAEEDAASSLPLFARQRLSDHFEAVGNSPPPAAHGVVDAHAVKSAMLLLIRQAIDRSRVRSSAAARSTL